MKTLITAFAVIIFAFFAKTAYSQSETTMQDILEKVTDKVYPA